MTSTPMLSAECARCGDLKHPDRAGQRDCADCARYDTEQRRARDVIGLAGVTCGLCGQAGHNRRTCNRAAALSVKGAARPVRRGSNLCQSCNAKSHILETRSVAGGTSRRRRCPACSARWTTFEIDVDDFAALVNKGAEAARLVAIFKNIVKEDA